MGGNPHWDYCGVSIVWVDCASTASDLILHPVERIWNAEKHVQFGCAIRMSSIQVHCVDRN